MGLTSLGNKCFSLGIVVVNSNRSLKFASALGENLKVTLSRKEKIPAFAGMTENFYVLIIRVGHPTN